MNENLSAEHRSYLIGELDLKPCPRCGTAPVFVSRRAFVSRDRPFEVESFFWCATWRGGGSNGQGCGLTGHAVHGDQDNRAKALAAWEAGQFFTAGGRAQ